MNSGLSDRLPGSLLLTLSILGLSAAAVPAESLPAAFSQGRVWLVLSVLLSSAVLLMSSHHKVFLSVAVQVLSQRKNQFLLLWLGLALISNVLAPERALAFFGSEYGQMGWMQLALCAALFLIAQQVVITAQHWRWLSAGVVLLLLISLAEVLGFRPLFWLPEATAYPAATIGQRGHLAGFFIVVAGVAGFRRAWPTLLMAGLGVALCNNTSALIAYCVLLAGIWTMDIQRHRVVVPLMVCVLVTTGLFRTSESLFRPLCESLGHQNCYATKNLEGLEADASSLADRWVMWQASINMTHQRPWLGWGNEQFASQWLAHLPESERLSVVRRTAAVPNDTPIISVGNVFMYRDPVEGDKIVALNNVHPHNSALGELQSHGVIGFAVLLATAVTLIREKLRLVLPILGYLLYLLAWFPVFAVLPVFALLLGTLICDDRRGGPAQATLSP